MKEISYIILIILLITILIPISIQSQLRWAFEIFRHGARTPYSGMNSSFYDCFGLPWIGLKELTGVGLRQHFLVGSRNRIKYMIENKLIKEQYDPREVFLISTDSNRTIMSANAQVQGLYPPGTGPTLYPNQSESAIPPVNLDEIKDAKDELDQKEDYAALPKKMNIIPVHSFFNADHFIQLQDKKVCKPTNEYYKRNQQREEVTKFLGEMTNKYGDYLNETLIIEDKSVDVLKDYTKAYYIFDTIICRYTEGYPLPKLGEISDEELLKDSFKFFDLDLLGNGINNDSEICLYSMSPIFDRILKWINLKIEKDKIKDFDYTNYDLPKFVMFSAHDSTCAAFMGFMRDVFGAETRYPYFATNINLELYLDNGKYYIEYIINDESMLNITYDEFVGNLSQKMKTMDEVNKFCEFTKEETEPEKEKDQNEDNDDAIYLWVNIALGIVSVILLGIIIFTIKKKKITGGSVENIDEIQPFNSEQY